MALDRQDPASWQAFRLSQCRKTRGLWNLDSLTEWCSGGRAAQPLADVSAKVCTPTRLGLAVDTVFFCVGQETRVVEERVLSLIAVRERPECAFRVPWVRSPSDSYTGSGRSMCD